MASESIGFFPGQRVCCCDFEHREIDWIDGDDVTTTDGGNWSAKYCLTPAKDDDSCHSEALERLLEGPPGG